MMMTTMMMTVMMKVMAFSMASNLIDIMQIITVKKAKTSPPLVLIHATTCTAIIVSMLETINGEASQNRNAE